MTDQEIQQLRNDGHDDAADEIERLKKYVSHCQELIAAYKATSTCRAKNSSCVSGNVAAQ